MLATRLLALCLALAAVPVAAVTAANPCPDQPVHTYGLPPLGAHGRVVVAGGGIVAVADTNLSECDGNPDTMADFDGDYDVGTGGAFFGYGAWAADPYCSYGLNTHGGNVAVSDAVFGADIIFVVGEDDQSGPIKIQDPVDGSWTCTTNGSITPCPDNDPTSCGPTGDPDDCLSQVYMGFGATCGTGGGDGGFTVFVPPPKVPCEYGCPPCPKPGSESVGPICPPPVPPTPCPPSESVFCPWPPCPDPDPFALSCPVHNPPTFGTITAY